MPPAPQGNKNAQAGETPMESTVVLRVTRKEKAAWVKAAQPFPLATWIRDGLNWLAKNPTNTTPSDPEPPCYKE